MKKTHGMSKTRFYGIWNDMVMRCHNPKKERYNCYGGRGIVVCKRWRSFKNFHKDLFSTYKPGLSLERKNVNKNYCKSNCKWIPKKDQRLNKQKTIFLTIAGVKKRVLEWSHISGTNEFTIYNRIKLGWGHKECVFGNGKRERFTDDKKNKIASMLEKGLSLREIGRKVNTSHSAIRRHFPAI